MNELTSSDAELLRSYEDEGAESAFAALVQRRVDFVYAAALRRVGGDAHLAEDVTQQVFLSLARNAGELKTRIELLGWLYTTTRFAAAQAVRTECRRRKREAEADIMNRESTNDGAQAEWERLWPVLDAALDELKAGEREAVLLRFFAGQNYGQIGARLSLGENSARMRVERALEKLHAQLYRRGVTSTTAGLAIALANHAVTAAPVGLAATVTGTALAGGTAAAAVGAGVFMGLTKIQVAVCGTLLAVGAGGLTWQQRTNARLADEVRELRGVVAHADSLRAENAQLARRAAEVQALRESNEAELGRLGDDTTSLQQRLSAEARVGRAAANTSGAAKIYSLSEIEKPPAATFRSTPLYPDAERMAGREGKVLVEFVVDAAGQVLDARAVEATSEAFAASAVAALQKWKFDPGQKGGMPVGVRIRQSITFAMSKEAAAAPTFWF